MAHKFSFQKEEVGQGKNNLRKYIMEVLAAKGKHFLFQNYYVMTLCTPADKTRIAFTSGADGSLIVHVGSLRRLKPIPIGFRSDMDVKINNLSEVEECVDKITEHCFKLKKKNVHVPDKGAYVKRNKKGYELQLMKGAADYCRSDINIFSLLKRNPSVIVYCDSDYTITSNVEFIQLKPDFEEIKMVNFNLFKSGNKLIHLVGKCFDITSKTMTEKLLQKCLDSTIQSYDKKLKVKISKP